MNLCRNRTRWYCVANAVLFCLRSMILTAVLFCIMHKLSLNTERKSDGMQKLLSILVYLILLIFLESAAEVTGVPASAPAALPEEPNYVALTFDDGPRRDTTIRLLDGLRERGANATFFLVGERLAGNEDLVLRMQAEGHQVGTHTWSHIRLDGTDPAAQLRDIQMAQDAVCKILGTENCWLRPPYGLIDPAVRTGVTVPMVHWTVDPRDWESKNTAQVVRSVLKDVQSGDIILLHDIYPTSVEAALQITDMLEARGYWFVTVEELLELNGIRPQAGVMYRSGRA